MIPSDLLRVKVDYKNNKIQPNFCSLENDSLDFELANQIIHTFQYCYENKLTKEKLNALLKDIESAYKDYKLIRGLSYILEKRCKFMQVVQTEVTNSHSAKGKEILKRDYSASEIRQIIFEEAALEDIAITQQTRDKVLDSVSNRLNMSKEMISTLMWSDMEENMVLDKFVLIKPEQLLLTYNIALVQTLLFNCTRLRLRINSNNSTGSIWKKILWKVKRLGLMYWLEIDNSDLATSKKNNIICTIEGPLNILKMTEKYGTSIAKLVPHIIKSDYWHINAEIIRLSANGKRIKYFFEISDGSNKNVLPLDKITELYSINVIDQDKEMMINIPSLSKKDYNEDNRDRTRVIEDTFTDYQHNSNNDNDNKKTYDVFDSNIEKIFLQKFKSFQTGWIIEREPEPLITKQNTAFISDFVLSKYGNKIFVEIIGFWTTDYLERKIAKISEILEKNNSKKFYMILIINFENLASYELHEREKISRIREKENVLIISYKKDNISLKEIITFLNEIENKYLNQHIEKILDFNKIIHQSVNSIKEQIQSTTTRNSNIDLDFVVEEYQRKFKGDNANVLEKINLKDLLKKNKEFEKEFKEELLKEQLVLIHDSIIQLKLIKEIANEIEETMNLKEATELLSSKKLTEKIQLDLLTFMGFRIEWNGLDYANARIYKFKENEILI